MGSKRKVIFLDIDGVLQPLEAKGRFENDLDKLKERLALEYNNDDFLEVDKYDLGAVYYDWNKEAIAGLKRVLEKTGAEIVISSSWRQFSPMKRLKAFFKIHGLDKYITEYVPLKPKINRHANFRADEIAEYLATNTDIENYVVLDDIDLSEEFPDNHVNTAPYFSKIMIEKAIFTLEGRKFEMRDEVMGIHEGSVLEHLGIKYKVTSKVKYQTNDLDRRLLNYESIVIIVLENKKFILYFPITDWFYLSTDTNDLDSLRNSLSNDYSLFSQYKYISKREKIYFGKEDFDLEDYMVCLYTSRDGRNTAYMRDLDNNNPVVKLEQISFEQIIFTNQLTN